MTIKNHSLYVLLALSLFPVPGRAQGPLAPNAGPPAPTMKSLSQIWSKIPVAESRIPISSLPFTIDGPGVYYLTGDLEFSDSTGPAIFIGAQSVTLDLGGFRIISTDNVTGDAISCIGTDNITIMNGKIIGATIYTPPSSVFSAGFSTGINNADSLGCQFKDLQISGCRANGIVMGGNSSVKNVISYSNGANGIFATQADNDLSHCQCTGNKNYGILSHNSLLNSCVASSNGAGGLVSNGGVVSNCLARSNRFDGIAAPSGVVSFCSTSNNNLMSGLNYLNINATGATRTGNLPTP